MATVKEIQDIESLTVNVCAGIAEDHAKFCKHEADHGGSHDLYERATGALHIAKKIRELFENG